MCKKTVCILCGCIALGTAFDLGAQEFKPFRVPSSELPQYVMVKQFLASADRAVRRSDMKAYDALVDSVGIARDSSVDEALLAAALETGDILAINPFDTSLPPEEFESYQIEVRRMQMKRLAEVYAKFLAEMQRSGVSRARLDLYLNERVRPAITRYSTGDPLDSAIMKIEADFDDELAVQLDRELSQGQSGKGVEE